MDELETKLVDVVGFSGGAAFDQLRAMSTLAKDEIAGPMFDAVGGLGDALAGLHNTGLLNQEMFAGLAGEVSATYAALVEQGKGGDDALRLMQPTLQRLWELQQDFGYQVDDGTKAMLDQATAAGVVGDQFRSAQERMVVAIEALVEKLDGFFTTMTTGFARAGTEAAAGLGRAFASIEMPTVSLKYRYEAEGGAPFASLDSETSPMRQTIAVNLDGHVIAQAAVEGMPDVLSVHGGY